MPLPENSPESQRAKLAIAIAQGASISTWAKVNNVPNRTAYRWASDPKVRAKVERSRRPAVDCAVGHLSKNAAIRVKRTQRRETRQEASPHRAGTCITVREAFQLDIPDSQAGKPDVRRRTPSRSDLPELWRPRTLANAAADAPCGGRFRAIRRVPRDGQFRRLEGRWHRDPFLAQAAERFGTAVSRDEKALKSGGVRRYKLWIMCSLRTGNLSTPHTAHEPRFASIPNMVKWHKRPRKAATLCHFLSAIHDLEAPQRVAISARATHGRHLRSERRCGQRVTPASRFSLLSSAVRVRFCARRSLAARFGLSLGRDFQVFGAVISHVRRLTLARDRFFPIVTMAGTAVGRETTLRAIFTRRGRQTPRMEANQIMKRLLVVSMLSLALAGCAQSKGALSRGASYPPSPVAITPVPSVYDTINQGMGGKALAQTAIKNPDDPQWAGRSQVSVAARPIPPGPPGSPAGPSSAMAAAPGAASAATVASGLPQSPVQPMGASPG